MDDAVVRAAVTVLACLVVDLRPLTKTLITHSKSVLVGLDTSVLADIAIVWEPQVVCDLKAWFDKDVGNQERWHINCDNQRKRRDDIHSALARSIQRDAVEMTSLILGLQSEQNKVFMIRVQAFADAERACLRTWRRLVFDTTRTGATTDGAYAVENALEHLTGSSIEEIPTAAKVC